MDEIFDEDYYKSGNYNNYLERKFDKQADDIIREFNLKIEDIILDYGCARGGLLNALKQKGFNNIVGTDVSFWAIENGKKQYNFELQHYNRNLLTKEWDIIICLDVLEHVNTEELEKIFFLFGKTKINKGIIIRIPVIDKKTNDFVLEISKNDKTHIQKKTKEEWNKLFEQEHFKSVIVNTSSIYESKGVLARIYKQSERNKIGQFSKGHKPFKIYKQKIKINCSICNNSIIKTIKSTKQFCSRKCSDTHRAKIMSMNRQGKNNPMYGKKHTTTSKNKMSNTTINNYSIGTIQIWNKGLTKEIDERVLNASIKQSNTTKGTRMGSKNPNWNGGISKLPYPLQFNNKLKKQIKQRDNYKCQNEYCFKNSKRLVIHHIDYNKQNINHKNLITVCQSCNARAGSKNKKWEKYYKNKIGKKE